MATITVPTMVQVLQKLCTDLQTLSPDANPFENNSLLRNEFKALSNRINSIYQLFSEVKKQIFISSATGDFLEEACTDIGISRIPATQSSGNVSFQGTVATTIPINTEMSDSSGNIFTSQSENTVESLSKSVTLSASSGLVTVTFADAHLLGNGFSINISGADTDYNGDFTCVIVDSTTITYNSTNGTLSGTSSGDCDYSLASVEVKSSDYGSDTLKNAGDTISFTTPISDIETDGKVQQSGFTGGADEEDDESLSERGLDKKQNPATNMNLQTIENRVLELGIADRAIVAAITPDIGQFTVYCLKDTFIPLSNAELTSIKDYLIADDGVVGVNTDSDDVFVTNPTLLDVDFSFASIAPDNASMRTAIENSITDLFTDVSIGQDITLTMINRAILNSATSEDTLTDFTLTTPSATITVDADEIAVLGTITFA